MGSVVGRRPHRWATSSISTAAGAHPARALAALPDPSLRQLPAATLSEALSIAFGGTPPIKSVPGPLPRLAKLAALAEEDSESS